MFLINVFLFLKDTATTEIYTYCNTLSLHDAPPISVGCDQPVGRRYLYSPDPPEAARGLRRWRRTCSATTPRRRHPTTALPARRLSPSGCAPTVSPRWWGRSI